MIAAKHVGKAHATSIFLFRERQIRQALPNERPKPDAWTGRWHLSRREYTMEKREKQEKYPARIGPDKIYFVTITRT